MWWALPTELVDQILHYVSFDDYVALTQTCVEARQSLDTQSQFVVVLYANFRTALDAYDWELHQSITRASLWTGLGNLRRFLSSLEHAYPTNQKLPLEGLAIDDDRGLLLETALRTFASDAEYFLPLILELNDAKKALQRDAKRSIHQTHSFSVSKISWLRKMLQIQNFLHAVKFFKEVDPSDKCLSEKCFFELSRCYIEFPELAKYRALRLADIRKHIASLVPFSTGLLKFPDNVSYRTFLGRVIKTILSRLNVKLASPGPGGNILRAYKGIGGEHQQLHCSIVAKIFQEEIFDRFSFEVAGMPKETQPVHVAPVFLRLGSLFILINFENRTWSMYEPTELRRITSVALAQATEAFTIRSILRRVFDSERSLNNFPQNLFVQNWESMNYSTSVIKLRFLRTVLITICDRKSLHSLEFSPLVSQSDFYFYFHCTMLLSEGPDINIPPFQNYIGFTFERANSCENFHLGDMIFNQSSDYFGVIMGHESSTADGQAFLSILPFDNIEMSTARHASVAHLRVGDFGKPFVKFLSWLMSTDGMTYAGMFLFPRLHVSREKLSLAYGSGDES